MLDIARKNRKRVTKGILGAVLLLALAGCGIGLPWINLPAPDAEHHDVLLVGDRLMASTNQLLPGVLTEATIVDEHRNGSSLVKQVDGMDPVDFVTAMLDDHPDTDTVLAGWVGSCSDPCPFTYGSTEFYDAWNASRQAIADAIAARTDPPTLVWVISPPAPPDPAGGVFDFTQPVSDALSWQTRAWAATESVATADWWAPLVASDGFLGHYDDFLAFQVWPEAFATPHRVRTDDGFLLTVDGSLRTSVWTAAALRGVWA